MNTITGSYIEKYTPETVTYEHHLNYSPGLSFNDPIYLNVEKARKTGEMLFHSTASCLYAGEHAVKVNSKKQRCGYLLLQLYMVVNNADSGLI